MNRTIIQTADGSSTISIPDAEVTYHSIHGAIGESAHVFIEAGFRHLLNEADRPEMIRVFEMGFGTGLNALMTMIAAAEAQQPVYYESVEAFPLEADLYSLLNYCRQLNRPDLQPLFDQLHTSAWGVTQSITPFFTFKKTQAALTEFSTPEHFQIIYYDAFAPNAQPDLWTITIFEKLFNMLEQGGILTTYCSKGDVRRAMQAAGFSVEKIPGPPGKREMVRAKK